MKKTGETAKSYFTHGLFIALMVLSLVIIVGEGVHITGNAVMDPESAKAGIQSVLSTAAFSRVMQSSICIVVNDQQLPASFSAVKSASGWTVTETSGFCKGLKAEDIVVQFPTYASLSAVVDNPSPKNIATAVVNQNFQILESKYVELGGNVICDATFKVKYCSALNSMATPSELIEGDMVCCLDKLTSDQTKELKAHLEDGQFKDEIGLVTEKASSTGGLMSSTTLIGGGLAAAVIMIILIFVVMRGKKSSKASNMLSPAQMPPGMQMHPTFPTEDPQVTELRHYVSQTLSEGYTAEELRAHLIEIGWDQGTADRVLTEEYNKLAAAN